MAQQRAGARYFRLFDLPQELRDHVYSLATAEVRKLADLSKGAMTEGYVLGAPIPAVLQTNRRLNEEYSKTVYETMRLVVMGYPQTEQFQETYPPIKPAFARSLRHCTIFVNVLCGCKGTNKRRCPAIKAIPFHQHKISELSSRLPSLQTVDLKIGLWALENERVTWPLPPHIPDFDKSLEQMIDLPWMQSLDIIDCGLWYWRMDKEFKCLAKLYQHSVVRQTDEGWRISGIAQGTGVHELPVLASWTRMDGWRQPVSTSDG